MRRSLAALGWETGRPASRWMFRRPHVFRWPAAQENQASHMNWHRRLAGTILRWTVRIAAVSVVGWWLFADTYARHWGTGGRPNEIRFAHFGTFRDYELWRGIIEAFEHEYPGTGEAGLLTGKADSRISIRQEYVVGLAGHYNVKLRQQILSGTLPDVALVQLGPFHEIADHFADLSHLADALSAPDALDSTGVAAFRSLGRQAGLPVSGGNLMIYCNTVCFERAGKPALPGRLHGTGVPLPRDDWTIDDFLQTARLLTCDFDGDGSLDQFGFWLPRWVYYLPFLWSFGGDVTSDGDTRWALNDQAAHQALAFYRSLAVGDRVCPRDEEVPQLFQDVGFLTGKVAMCVNGPWFEPFLAETQLADTYVVRPIPKGPAGRKTRITWDGIVIARDLPAGRRQIAERFVAFVLSKTVQDRIARTGRALPARIASVAAYLGTPVDPRRRCFVDGLAYSRTQPLLAAFGEVDRAINRHLDRLLDPRRAANVAQVLDDLASDPVIVRHFPTSRANAQELERGR